MGNSCESDLPLMHLGGLQLCIRREVYLNEPVPQPAHARYLETDTRDNISLQPEEKAMVLAVRLLDGLGLKLYGSDRAPL